MPSLERVRWAQFRVTAMTVVALLILATLLYELYGAQLLSPKTAVYVYVPDGSGLSGDSPVRVDGIDVGKVSDVVLSGSKDPNRIVRVTIDLQRDRLRTIPADSVAQLSSDSLVGDKFVDISSGTSPRTLAPEGEIVYKDQPELVRSLDLAQFTAQLRQVDAMLQDIEEGRSQFGKFYQGTAFYDDLIKRLRQMNTAFQAAVGTSTLLGGLFNSDQVHNQVDTLLLDLDQSIAKIQSGQGPGGQLLRSSAQYDQLLASVQSFRKALGTFAASDLVQSDTAYDNANQFFVNMIANVDQWNRNPDLATTFLYDNLNGSLKELRDSLHDFRLNPHKYMRLKVF